MEFLLDLIDDNLPTQILCIIILLIIVLKDVRICQNLKVGILYIASFVMMLMGLVNIRTGVLILVLAEFALLEIFTEDVEKQSLFGIWYKIIDCLYRLFVEYYFILYIAAVAAMTVGALIIRRCNSLLAGNMSCCVCGWQSEFAALVVLFASALILAAILCITRMKFETKPVTEIMNILRTVSIYSVPVDDMEIKFRMLVDFEDKTFLIAMKILILFSRRLLWEEPLNTLIRIL